LPEIRVAVIRRQEWISHGLESLSRGALDSHYSDLPTYPFDTSSQEYTDAVIRCLSIHARLLKTYGQPFLQGDPSQLQNVCPGQFTGNT
jgi:hypothetical protein